MMEMSQSPTAELPPKTTAELPPQARSSRWRAPQVTLSWLLLGSSCLMVLWHGLSGSPESGSPPVAGTAAEQAATLGANSGAMSPFLVLGLWAVGLVTFVLGCVLAFRAARSLWRGEWVSLAAPAHARHGFYVEAFVLWVVLSIVVTSIVEGFRQAGLSSPVLDALQLQPLVLPALLWAGLRGSTWQMLRDDLGLRQGQGVARELGAGVLGYLAKLPLSALALVVTVSLMALVGMNAQAAAALHPSVQVLQSGSGVERAVIWVAAVVLAPVCEELVFRGLLWRHLRSLSGRLAWLSRPVPTALASGLIFASLHPQGALAVPALLVEGFALAMVRDWRGSLIAPITVHVLQNGVLMAFLGTPV
jgi:membrane protease YdiL (CAAX protease family)